MEARWRVLGSEEWLPLQPSPGDNTGFVEACPYEFAHPSEGCSFNVDDAPLPENQLSYETSWRWTPGFYAGEVTAELLAPDGTRAGLYLLDVAPASNKVGRDLFQGMVDELWNEDPAFVIGSEPATHQIGELGTFEDPWLAFARLRRYAPDFLRAMAAVRARPRRSLRARRDSTALHQVRRVDRRSVTALVRSPAAALFVEHPAGSICSAQHVRLDVPVVEQTVDSSANRTMLALTLALRQRARVIRERLHQLVVRQADSETRTALDSRWPTRRATLDAMDEQLTRLAARWPFSEVSRAEITAAGLTNVAADPAYARAWSSGWRALRQGVDAPDTTERLWMSPTWEIYERWCFVRLGKMLREAFPDCNFRRLVSPHRWVGSHQGRRAELSLQPTFSSSPVLKEGRWSISKQREPDLLLTVDGLEAPRFLVLDAKYRTARANVLDAMSSAHIYQDSLRIGARRPEASLLLIPAGGGAPWLESGSFHAEHRVGALVLSPSGQNAMPALLSRLIESGRD